MFHVKQYFNCQSLATSHQSPARSEELSGVGAQWSKLCEVSNEQTILGTTRELNIC